jgi:hypothetical protein
MILHKASEAGDLAEGRADARDPINEVYGMTLVG